MEISTLPLWCGAACTLGVIVGVYLEHSICLTRIALYKAELSSYKMIMQSLAEVARNNRVRSAPWNEIRDLLRDWMKAGGEDA